jgi:hypothetical protein
MDEEGNQYQFSSDLPSIFYSFIANATEACNVTVAEDDPLLYYDSIFYDSCYNPNQLTILGQEYVGEPFNISLAGRCMVNILQGVIDNCKLSPSTIPVPSPSQSVPVDNGSDNSLLAMIIFCSVIAVLIVSCIAYCRTTQARREQAASANQSLAAATVINPLAITTVHSSSGESDQALEVAHPVTVNPIRDITHEGIELTHRHPTHESA